MVKKTKYFFCLALLLAMCAAFTQLHISSPNGIKIIVIDPGHGGKDPGCSGSIHQEKEVALAVALKLGKLLEENFKDVKVIFTRTSDVFVGLEDRAQIANKAKADLFLSIHCNAAGKPVMVKDAKTGKSRPKMYKKKNGKYVVVEKPNPVPFGTETYVMGLKNEEGKMKVATRENSAIFDEEDYEKKYGGFDPDSEESYIIMSNYTSAYVIQSANLAVKIQAEYANKAGRIDKGVHRQSIWVLWRTSMPSVLTEIGYLTNPLEEKFLGSDKGQDYLAKALFRGLRKYKDDLEGVNRVYTDAIELQAPLQNENVLAGHTAGNKKNEEEDELISPVIIDNTTKIDSNKKQSVDDDKFVEVPLKKNDSALNNTTKKDTGASGPEKLYSMNRFDSKPTTSVEVVSKVIYKVQFASSDGPMNLKQVKYAAITDGDFYKVNNVLKYTSGKFTSFKEATKHKNSLKEKGFNDCFVIAFKGSERITISEAIKISGE